MQTNTPVPVLADSAAASLMAQGRSTVVIVGADRIAVNGDVANKVGTYAPAIAASHHGFPLYVDAPSSTVDAETATRGDIQIEHRDGDEPRVMIGRSIAPAGVAVYNPGFDLTPAALITAIITDQGIQRPPYDFAHATRSRY